MCLVPAMAVTACGDDDDDTFVGPSTLLDGSTDGRSNADGAVVDANRPDTGRDTGTPFDSGPRPDAGRDADADASTGPDADASTAPDADASTAPDADASTAPDVDAAAATLPDGKYRVTAWTCTPPGGTPKDIKAFMLTAPFEIANIDTTNIGSGTSATVDVIYSTNPACTRTSALSYTYPSAGRSTATNAAAFTCSATCAAAKCTTGTQGIVTDTSNFAAIATGYVVTRTLAAADTAAIPRAAGCANGDFESATYTLQP